MQPTVIFNQPTFKSLGESTATIWPVWKDSVKAEVQFRPVSKTQTRQLWFKARNWEQRTHIPGKHGGILGRSTLSVLYTLIHDFLNYKTGRLDPSIRAIAQKASVSERTCYTALKKLRSLRLIDWLRRCSQSYNSHGKFTLKQDTNAYFVQPAKHWAGHHEEIVPPPYPDATGAHPPRPEAVAAAAFAIAAGDREAAIAELLAEPADPLAAALAELGRLGRFI